MSDWVRTDSTMKRHPATSAFVIGVLIGVSAGAANAAPILLFFGFWAGLIFPLLILGPLALWFSNRHQRSIREALGFSVGLSLALSAFAVFDWYSSRGVNGNEIWFVSLLALLAGFVLSPAYVAMSRRRTSDQPSSRPAA